MSLPPASNHHKRLVCQCGIVLASCRCMTPKQDEISTAPCTHQQLSPKNININIDASVLTPSAGVVARVSVTKLQSPTALRLQQYTYTLHSGHGPTLFAEPFLRVEGPNISYDVPSTDEFGPDIPTKARIVMAVQRLLLTELLQAVEAHVDEHVRKALL